MAAPINGAAGESADRRQKLVDGQLRTGGVNDPDVLTAFLAVPREGYVAGDSLTLAYSDGPQRARVDGSPLMAPLKLARLIQALGVKQGESVLAVAGGGYSAAILKAMGAEVTEVSAGEAGTRPRTGGPFQAILVSGGFSANPDSLLALLAPGGKLAGFRLSPTGNHAVVIERLESLGTDEAIIFEGSAPVLSAFEKPAAFTF